jgi:epoxyqueuosine reductase
MKTPTMLETVRSLLGVPACAIPLSLCKPAKTYLLERAGISAAGTAILFAVPYVMMADVYDPARNLSLYAVPRDYHGYAEELKTLVLPSLEGRYPDLRFALFADHSPILEVDAAARAGLGLLGCNGLLLTPDYGSLVFLMELITDADYTAVTGQTFPTLPAEPPLCEGCGLCLRACPMGCGTGDRSDCLSALTQKKGELTSREAAAMVQGGLVWGCDACQLACPHNRAVIAAGRDTPIPYFREHRLVHLSSEALEAMDEASFRSRAYAWRGRAVITRNLQRFQEECRDGEALRGEEGRLS